MSSNHSVLSISSWFPTKDNPLLGNFILKHLKIIAEIQPTTWLIIEGVKNEAFVPFQTSHDGKLKIVRIQYIKSNRSFINYFQEKKILKKYLNENNKFSLIIGNVIFPKAYLFLAAKKTLNVDLIIIEHSAIYRETEYKRWNFKTKYLHKKAIRACKYIVAVSEFLKKEIEFIFPEANVKVIPNVVDDVFFKENHPQTSSTLKFLHVSNLDEKYKNVIGIFRSFKRLVDLDLKIVELLIISDIVSEEHLNWVKENHLENHIHFKGPLSSEGIAQEMSTSNALVHFSNYETFSCVLAEAMVSNLPIISTKVGILHSTNTENVIIVTDEESLFQAMLGIGETNQKKDRNNHEISIQFTRNYISTEFKKLIHQTQQ
jgi:glycosyltransferase involved in cell wall biosynthesis